MKLVWELPRGWQSLLGLPTITHPSRWHPQPVPQHLCASGAALPGSAQSFSPFPCTPQDKQPCVTSCLPPPGPSLCTGAAVVFAKLSKSCGGAKCPSGCSWKRCSLRRQFGSAELWLWLYSPGGSCYKGNRCFVPVSKDL